jgi:predicted lipoprotein
VSATAPRTIPWRIIVIAATAIVIAAMALDATWRSDKEARPTAGPPKFDAAAYRAKNFPKVVAAIDKRAVALPKLAAAIKQDPDAAGQQYGVRQGSSPYNFAVTGEGVAGKHASGLLAVKVPGAHGVSVNLQIGPAINGTSLRDVAGFITFNQFIN